MRDDNTLFKVTGLEVIYGTDGLITDISIPPIYLTKKQISEDLILIEMPPGTSNERLEEVHEAFTKADTSLNLLVATGPIKITKIKAEEII